MTLNNLTPSTKYYVYVRALCPNDPDEQQSNWSTIEFTTAVFNCDAPTGEVKLNDMNPEESIIVKWTPNAQQIELYNTTDDGFEPTSETEANENVTSSDIDLGFHAITGLTVNTTYYVWARAVCDLEMGNDGKSEWRRMGSATTEADKKIITFENVTYTISGIHQGKVTITDAMYDEDDLTPVDYDITYAENEDEEPDTNDYFNYKYVINVPEKFIDTEQNNTEYEVIAINANAFDNSIENENIRVNIPLNIVDGQSVDENVIISLADENRIINYGNTYYASKAYKVNTCNGAVITQRPFGEQTLKISCPDDKEGTDEDGVVTTQTGARLDFEDGWTETSASTSNLLEASLDEEEAVITTTRLNKVRIAATAENVNIPKLENCEELKFQTDNVNRSYPDCQLTGNMPLGDGTKVKAEMKFNNREYYYFSLPFDCDDFKVMAGTDVVERSNSIDEAINSEDLATHHYVLFKWDESAYTDSSTTGYVAFSGTKLEKNKGYVIAIVESAGWYDTYWNVDGASLDVIATFTASNYTEIASSESNVEIPVTRADAANAFSGWNLVGNPFYGAVKSSQYSFNNYDTIQYVKYVRKVLFDRGGEDVSVGDYTSGIPVLNVDIKPFETVFIQKSDIDGDGTVTVSGTSPVQPVQGAPAILPEYITITLNDSSRMIDRTTIINGVLSSDDFLQEEDLVKSHQGSNEIYTQYGDYDFSFNEMNITDADKTIPLAVKVAAEGNYTIAMSSGLSNYGIGDVILHDKILETYMKLSDGEVETLHLTEGVTEGRLELVIKVDEVITIADNAGDETSGIEVYMHHGIATIEGVEEGATVTITDATGKTLYTTTAQSDRIDYQFIVRGVYMITVRNNNSVNTVKVVY